MKRSRANHSPLLAEVTTSPKGLISIVAEAHPSRNFERYFTAVYNNYYKAIYKVVNRIITDAGDAEDATQLSFIKVARHIPDYDSSKGVLYTWIAKIATNTSLDMLRSPDYQRKRATDSLMEQQLDQKFWGFYNHKIDLIGLKNLLARLTPKERAITELLYFKGYTQSEAADELDIPLGTIKGLSRSSITKFKRICANEIRYCNKLKAV
jgi:RNA polymerase sigma-70 factor (ECF subfamily)